MIVLGGYLRGYHLGHDCFDQDELYAIRITGVSPSALGAVVARDGLKTNHPPLMSVPYLFWTAAFGTDETAVRILPWLASVLTLPAVFWLGWLLGCPRAGLIAALILAINPLHISYAQEARQYALLGLLVTLSHVYAVRCVFRGRRWDYVFYLVTSALALLTHYFAAPALLGHLAVGACLMLNRLTEVRAAGVRLVMTLGLAGLGLAAWLPVTRYQSTIPWGHLTDPTAAALLEAFADTTGVRFAAEPWWTLAAVAVLALLTYGFVTAAGRRLSVLPGDLWPPLPRWFGFAAIGGGLVGLAASFTLVPRYLFPIARQALEGYQYDATTIDTELGVIGQTATAYTVAAIVFGATIVLWEWLVRWSSHRLASVALTDRLPSGSGFVTALLLTAIGVIAVLGILNVPFLSTRNMIVLCPVVAVGLGLAMDRMLESRTGRGIAIAAAVLLVVGAANYDASTAPFGMTGGRRLGMDTPDWKELDRHLQHEPLPIIAIDHPVTDPLLYYSRGLATRRMKEEATLDQLPKRLRLVHWTGLPDGSPIPVKRSLDLLHRLESSGFALTDEHRQPGLLIVLVERR